MFPYVSALVASSGEGTIQGETQGRAWHQGGRKIESAVDNKRTRKVAVRSSSKTASGTAASLQIGSLGAGCQARELAYPGKRRRGSLSGADPARRPSA